MCNSEQDRLLEIYKLHAELADRVSQRREAANRLYVSLHVGILLFMAAMLRFGFGDIPEKLVLVVLSLFGAALSISWFVIIRSYRQLNSLKFAVLPKLEEHLPFQFFKSEWEVKGKGVGSRYWRLTYVEVTLPFIFLVLFIGALIYFGVCTS